MTVRFTARHMSGGSQHQHITSLRWIEDGTTGESESTRETLIAWIRDKEGKGYVVDARGDKAWVHVVNVTPPYLQTWKDGIWTDNLLALTTY
jgi:Protein of unknown function (DUF3892)